MTEGSLYKIKHFSGRILGPLDLPRIRKLILKNQILGTELARAYPEGNWKDINQYPEISKMLLAHARGTLERETKNTLSSHQSSYRPILAKTKSDALAPTVVLPTESAPETKLELESLPPPEEKPPEPVRPVDDESKTIQVTPELNLPGTALSLEGDDDKTEMNELLAIESPVIERQNMFQAVFPDFKNPFERKISTEPTIMIDRSTGKRTFRLPKGKELFRVVLISALLGYFGYDSFLAPEPKDPIFSKLESFRPKLPNIEVSQVNPQLSQKLYQEAMKIYVLDHVMAYKGSAIKLLQASARDPDNVKALAMLASCYINLIDSSNKDENYFSVITKLIEMSKAKNVDVPETVIADVEFFLITNRADAAVNRIVEYTKSNPKFDHSMFFYLSRAFVAKGDYGNAAKYMAFFPDNKAFSPGVFFLRAQIAEALGNVADAKIEYQKALNMSETHARSRLSLVSLNVKEGRLKESGPEIKKLVDHPELLSPKDLALAYFYYGQFFQLSENWDAASAALERSVRLDRTNHDYLLEYYTLKARTGDLVSSAKQDAKMFYYLGEGEKSLKFGKTHEALTQFLQARDARPDSVIPYAKIGDMFLHLNDMVNARLNYKKAAELAPNSIEIWSKYISVLIQSYEWEDAQKAMDKFRKLPVSQSAIDKAAGDMYAKQNRHQEAQVYYKKAMLRESIDPDVYIAYAKSLMATKNYKEAPFFFALAQRFDPLNLEAVMGSAQAIANSESLDAGIRMLHDLLQRGGFPAAEIQSGIAELLIQKGEWSAAQAMIDESRKSNPDYAQPWKLQAQIYMNQEGQDKRALNRALEAYKSYSDRNTSDPSGYLERYRIFVKKAEFEKANEELDRIYSIYPKYPNLHFYKGAMYGVMGNHKVAAQEYKSELDNNPNSVPTMIALGKELLELGDPKAATIYLTQAMKMAPGNAEAKFQSANANRGMKNYQGAIALYQEALRLDPGNPLIYKKMGECFIEMGDAMSARAAFKKYLEMEPDAQDRKEFERYL